MNQRSWTIERNYTDAFGRRPICARASITPASSAPGTMCGPVSVGPQTYQPDLSRRAALWLLVVQLYAVRSAQLGPGDFTDLRHFAELAARLAGGHRHQSAAHALHARAARIRRRAGCSQSALHDSAGRNFANRSLTADVERCGAPTVDYPALPRQKQSAASPTKFSQRGRCTRRLRSPLLYGTRERSCYAAFETARASARRGNGGGMAQTGPAVADLRASSRDVEFHEFVQWLADDQLRACRDPRAPTLPVGLYLDLAVGVEARRRAWAAQERACRPGARRRDAWNLRAEQGIASFIRRPDRSDFSFFRDTLRAVMRYAAPSASIMLG